VSHAVKRARLDRVGLPSPAMASVPLSDAAFLARIGVAAGLGFVVGWERHLRGNPAGERTFAVLALGTAGFTAFAMSADATNFTRVIQGITTGVGFIGAGLVWRSGEGDNHGSMVHGLTTAAAAWAIVAMGVLAGAGRFVMAATVAAFMLVILELFYLPGLRALDPRRFRARFRTDHDAPAPMRHHEPSPTDERPLPGR
jgi:putative Mg2+ transporter-C (MgtC) family protein